MLYRIGRTLFKIIFKVFYRLKIYGIKNLPKGGFIIVANHNSYIDPPLLGAVFPMHVYFMAKKELFDIPVLGYLIRLTNAIEIDRNSFGLASFKKTLNLLKKGKVLLIFPEGTRKSVDSITRGFAVLAHKAGVPVVPSKIYNNDKVHKFRQLSCYIEKPIYFPLRRSQKASKNDYNEFLNFIWRKIGGLKNEITKK